MTNAEDALRLERELRVSAERAAMLAQADLAAERLAVTQLDELNARLLTSTGLQPLLDEILNATISLQHADFGCMQLYNPATCALEMVGQHGLPQDFLEHFRDCSDETSVCGRALVRRERVIVEDVRNDAAFAAHRAVADSAGFRAVQSTPLFTRGGSPLGVISTHFRAPHRPTDRELRFTDLYRRLAAQLLERHWTDEALRSSEERFRRYFDLGLIGMAITSVEKGCLEVNDELCRILGYERHELLRLTWAEMTHPDDLAADVAQFERVLAGEIDGYTLDKRLIRKDGRIIHTVMAARCVRRAHRSVDYFVSLVLDTTERQRAKDELAQSERRFRMLLESIPHHVWSVRPDGSLGYWNRQLADYSGLTAEELRLGTWRAMHPDDVERVRAAWQAAQEEVAEPATGFETELRMLGRDGRYRRFVCRAVNIRDAEGRPVEWFGTNSDVEDRRQAEDAARKFHAQLARAAHATTLEEIAASIAHEISQPLAAVISNAQACLRWLTRQSPDLVEAAEAAGRAVRDANRASEVVTRIRALLRQEAPQVTPIDVKEVISEVIAMVEGDMRSHGVSLHTHADADLPAAAADRIQLQQVILNLIRNSLDAMDAVNDRARTLRIEIHRQGEDALRIAVCDSGVGLAPEMRDRIFDAFRTSKPGGLGLGLAISRSIVESHGGRLWTTPNESHGETFQFTLPTAAPRSRAEST